MHQFYELTDKGRNMTWARWLEIGGCGLSHIAQWRVTRALGPMAHWDESVTLGKIADLDRASGYGLPRFAATRLNRPDLGTPEQAQGETTW